MSLVGRSCISHSLETAKLLTLKDCTSLVFIHSLSDFNFTFKGPFLKGAGVENGLHISFFFF